MVDTTDAPSQGDDDPRLGLVRELFAGRYEIEEKLAWGGLAIVYGAREPGRDVAVSVLPLDCGGAPEIEDAFEIWSAGLEEFHHSGHVPVTDSGVQHGVPYLELEYVEGETLWQRAGSLPRLEALRVAIDVAVVVEAAHELGLVHWDLTPANVLLEGKGAASRVRVLGFGVSPLLFSTKDDKSTGPTGKGSGPKARRFMAPERLANAEGGLRADQYSLGALTYFLLRGEPPPKDGKRPRLDEIDGLDAVVARAMKVDPSDRFADVSRLRQALAAVLAKSQRKSREPSGVVENLADALEPKAVGAVAPHLRAPVATPAPTAPAGRAAGLWVGVVLLIAAALGTYVFTRGPASDTAPTADVDAATPPAPQALIAPAGHPGAASADAPAARAELDAGGASAPASHPSAPSSPATVSNQGAPLQPPLADLLSEALARVESGPPFTEPDLAPLYGYATAHPDEASAHVVMGHVFVSMHWNGAAADAFARAARVDDGQWSDPRVLDDLLLLAGSRDELLQKAWPPIRNRYGRDAISTVQAYSEHAPMSDRARLRRLLARLERLSSDSGVHRGAMAVDLEPPR